MCVTGREHWDSTVLTFRGTVLPLGQTDRPVLGERESSDRGPHCMVELFRNGCGCYAPGLSKQRLLLSLPGKHSCLVPRIRFRTSVCRHSNGMVMF